MSSNTEELLEQYRDAGNLNARIALHTRFSTNPYGWYRWVMDHLLARPQDARILELGCGPASTWASQQERVPGGWQITLSDFSAGMVEKARASIQGADHFFFAVQDAQAIAFPASSFDAVIANHMLYHVPDRQKALAEIRRVLKPGGVLFAATNGMRHMAELDEIIWRALSGLDSTAAQNALQSQVAAFSLETGREQIAPWFKMVQVDIYEDGLEVNEVQPLVDYILSMGFLFAPAQRSKLEENVVKITQAVEEELRLRGTIHITKNAGLFIAR